jgi:hypothetical protein
MRNPAGFQFYPGKRLPVVCRDGITRQAVATGYAAQGLPAAVQVTSGGKRRTVSGTVYPLPFSRLLSFYATGRNSDLIGWTAHKPRLAAAALRLIKATAYGHGAPGYIWDYAGDHAAALAGGCRLWFATSEWAAGGCAARAVLRRLPADLLPRLALYFDKLAALYLLHDPINGERLTPPPPPPPA